ncbi:MAG: DUF3995 domain-containing protein [Nesterenkonia sp.]|nr:DUF3995 domain-containing protein [Nesterenkonia sp.]
MRRSALAGTIIFGGLHAASSLWWGLGGRALLGTVGEGAVELREQAPWWVFAGLLTIGLLKLAAVAVPILHLRGALPRPRLWRVLCWCGAVGLIVYGGVHTVLALTALAGAFGPVHDPEGLMGHAFLWDPLFTLWGVCLAVALRRAPLIGPSGR